MQEPLSQLHAWENFYVIVGAAAGALTGLVFVMITLVSSIRRQSSNAPIATFGTPNVVHFCAVLLIAAIISAPWQALWNVCPLFGLCGLAGMIYVFVILRRMLRQDDYKPVLEDWIWHVIFPFISYTLFLVTALMLTSYATLALFGVAASTILLLFSGIHNAWDSVTYVVIEYSPKPNEGQDDRTG